MEKEIFITIEGLQEFEDDDRDQVKIITPGTYYQVLGKHYLMFEEVSEDYSERIKSLIKLQEGRVEISRRGDMNSYMVFEEGDANGGYLDTPVGRMELLVNTEKIHVLLEENLLEAQITYLLHINGDFVARREILLSAKPKGEISLD